MATTKDEEEKQLMLLQTSNTTKLTIYFILQCLELNINDNEYLIEIDKKSQVNLLQIIKKNQDKKIAFCLVGGTTKIKKIQMDNPKIFKIIKGNEKKIVDGMNDYYLNGKNNKSLKWNSMIGDFFGANFNMISYTKTTKNKLKQLFGGYIINESNINQENYSELTHLITRNHKLHTIMSTLNNVEFFTLKNKKQEIVETNLLNLKYDEAINILNVNESNKYNMYYCYIYKIIAFQKIYKQHENDINCQKKYFMKMRKLLCKLSDLMEPNDCMTCSLFADIILNYNPFKLSSSDLLFCKNMIISSCCYMFTDIIYDEIIFDLYGCINSYKLLLTLYNDKQININNNMMPIIIKNIDTLFEEYNDQKRKTQIENVSKWFNQQIKNQEILWEKQKKILLQKEKKKDENIKREKNKNKNKGKKRKKYVNKENVELIASKPITIKIPRRKMSKREIPRIQIPRRSKIPREQCICIKCNKQCASIQGLRAHQRSNKDCSNNKKRKIIEIECDKKPKIVKGSIKTQPLQKRRKINEEDIKMDEDMKIDENTQKKNKNKNKKNKNKNIITIDDSDNEQEEFECILCKESFDSLKQLGTHKRDKHYY